MELAFLTMLLGGSWGRMQETDYMSSCLWSLLDEVYLFRGD